METPKAKELLTLLANGYISRPDPDLRDAARVGAEALDRLDTLRALNIGAATDLLPSEAERRPNEPD